MCTDEKLYSTDAFAVFSFVRDLPTRQKKKEAMALLKSRDAELYFVVLGFLYDLAVYPITGDGVTEGAPAHEIGKYFVSTLATDFSDAPVIPLGNTVEAAFAIGCSVLDLENLFERECASERMLPRRAFQGDLPSLERQLAHVVEQTRKFEPMTPVDLGLKGAEEFGEFAQAVLVEVGSIRHKSLKEPSFGEAADVVLCMMAALAKLYPDMTPENISGELTKWLYIKQAKYDVLLQGHAERTPK